MATKNHVWIVFLVLLVAAAGVWKLMHRGKAGANLIQRPPAESTLDQVRQEAAVDQTQPSRMAPEPSHRVDAGNTGIGTLEVIVRDTEGSAIPAATLAVVTDGVEVFAATANELGHLVVQPRPMDPATLEVSALGYKPAQLDAPPEAQESVIVVLTKECALTGVVRIKGSGLPAPGITVAAEEHGRRIKGSIRWKQFTDGDTSIRAAKTDDEGRFAIVDLESGKRYSLRAGGNGFLDDTGSIKAHVAPEADIVLEVEQAYILTVMFQDMRTGDVIPVGGQPMGSVVVTARAGDRALRQLDSTGSFQSFLAGLDPITYADPSSLTLLFTYPADRQEVGPIVLDAQIQGYEQSKVPLFARAVSGGGGAHVVQMLRTADDFGEVALTWSSGGVAREVGPQPVPMGELHLTGEGATEIRLPVPLVQDSEFTLTRIPTGKYQWFATANHGAFRYPSEGNAATPIDVRAGGKCAVAVPLSGVGSLELQVRNRDGTIYDSTVQVQLQRTDPMARGGMVTFSGPPYRLIGLQSGTYTLKIYAPIEFYRDPNLQPPPVVIRTGDEQVLALAIP